MNSAAVLAQFRDLGVSFTIEEGNLRYRAPSGVMTPERVDELRTHKLAILERLRAESGNGAHGRAGSPVNGQAGAKDAAILDRFSRRRSSRRESRPADLHPYARFVEPVKSELLARVGLDKLYVRGEGCYLYDEQGRRILDFVAQYGALPFGYNPPEIWRALDEVRRAQRPNLATNSLLDGAGQLAKRLLELSPGDFSHVVFCNSGAESVEVAIKLCRSATNRAGIVSTKGGFHGLTLGALSTSGNQDFQKGFIVPGDSFHTIPYGDSAALRREFERRPDFYAAFLVEAVQGEAGIIPPPRGYLADVARICREHEVLLVVDEVQTGLGRTGKMFACQHEGVVPDVMTLAKALGGGLVPVGAVLCNDRAYSERFGLRHSSTFAGNALASFAGLASLDWLTRDNQALVTQVAENGAYLHARLKQLQQKYPRIIQTVRGVGYLQAVVFDFSSLKDSPGMLGFLGEQQLLIHLIISYLVNAERVRVAPSFMGRDVLRIEPPLIAGREECDLFVTALDRTLAVLDARNTAAFLAAMIGFDEQRIKQLSEIQTSEFRTTNVQTSKVSKTSEASRAPNGRFGFIIHLSALDDLRQFDDTLELFSEDELVRLKSKLVDYVDPFPIGNVRVTSLTGQTIAGQFVLVPYTPRELVDMPPDEARELVEMAVRTAADEGAQVIGLGGFTSILTQGGMSMDRAGLPPITTGNTYTVAAALHAVRQTCQERRCDLSRSTAAVVGAAGQIGQALAASLCRDVERLILIGSHRNSERSMRRLREVARSLVSHLRQETNGAEPRGSIPAQIQRFQTGAATNHDERLDALVDELIQSGALVLSTSVDEVLREADVIITATSETASFIESRHLKTGAIVCDASRPLNVRESVAAERPDVTLFEGGIIRLPGDPQLDIFAGPAPDRTFACVAETMLWSLEPASVPREISATLDLATVAQLESLANKHGFRVIVQRPS